MNLPVDEQIAYALGGAVDEFGNPVPVPAFDAPPAWSVSDSTLAAVQASDDGLSAVVVPTGKLGACKLQLLGAVGGKSMSGSDDLVLIPGAAVSVALVPGAFTANPVPAPAQA